MNQHWCETVPEVKRKLFLLGRDVDVTEVPIIERHEVPAEYHLEDGTIVRFATVATAVLRLDGQYDMEGNPVYVIKNGNVVTVIQAGPNAKKPLN
jgi:hypothetical protein